LFIEEVLELVSVIEGVESVLEHSKNLVRPELEDLLFVFIEVLVCLVESLEYL
jgi:NTP pyrophosphatase (non-canonical NTP hydrolase)